MNNALAVLAGTFLSATWLIPAAMAQPACVTQNMTVPPGANSTDKAAPFFIDTTGLDFKTTPPTRYPSNPNYPRATELPDGTLPPAGAEGNFIIGPAHAPAPETVAKDGVPRGTTTSFTMSSKDSVIYNPGLIRDDTPGCSNSSIMATTTAPGDKSSMIVTTSHPGTWTRTITVYLPPNYVAGTEAPFIVMGDGGSTAYKDLSANRQRRSGRPGQRARARVRHGVGHLHPVRRARGAAVGRAADRREADEEPRRPRDHGPELERRGGLHHGVVPSRALSPGAGLFADHGEPAMAVRPVAARRRLGVSQPVGGTFRP
jgi:hypothetical protein